MLLIFGAITVPEPDIIALMTSGSLCVFGPFFLFLLLRKPLSLRFIPFISGALLYMVFILLIENNFMDFLCGVDSPFYDALISNPALYMFVAGFSVGVIEEGGRYILFVILKRWFSAFSVSVSSTLGFSSIDATYNIGLRYIIYAFIAVDHNFRVVSGAPRLDYHSLILTLSQAYPAEYLLAGLERFLYIGIHVGLASLVWYAAVKPGRTYLLFGAVLLHAIFSAPSALRDIHVLNNMPLYFIVLSAFSLVSVVIAFLVHHADKRNQDDLSDPFSLL